MCWQADARFVNTQATMYAYRSSILRNRNPRDRDGPGDAGSRTCIKASTGEGRVQQTSMVPRERRYLQACIRGTTVEKADACDKKQVQLEPLASRPSASPTIPGFSPQPSALPQIQRASPKSVARLPGAEPASVSKGCAWFSRESVVAQYLFDVGRPSPQTGESQCVSSTDMWRGASAVQRSPVRDCSLQLQRAQKTVSQVQGYGSKKLAHPQFSRLTLPSSDPPKEVRQRRGLESSHSLVNDVKSRHRGGSAASLHGQSPPLRSGCNTNFCCSVWRRSRSHLTCTPRREYPRIAAQQPMTEPKDLGVPNLYSCVKEFHQPPTSKQRSTNDNPDLQTRYRFPAVERKVNIRTDAKPPATRIHDIPDKKCKLVPRKIGPTVMDVQRCPRGGSHSGIYRKEKRGTAVCRARSSVAKENSRREAPELSRFGPELNGSDKGARLRASRLASHSKSRGDPSKCVETRGRRSSKERITDLKGLSTHYSLDNARGVTPCDGIVMRARSTSRRPPNVPRLDLRRCKEYRNGV